MNKKAISEIVSYVLLIAITLSIASIVYVYISFYMPKEEQKCEENTAMILIDYSCNLSQNILSLEIKNKGQHSIDGFLIYASYNVSKNPDIALNETPTNSRNNNGRYFFSKMTGGLKPEEEETLSFAYPSSNSIKLLRLIPFIITENNGKSNIALCNSAILNQILENC